MAMGGETKGSDTQFHQHLNSCTVDYAGLIDGHILKNKFKPVMAQHFPFS